MLAVDDDVRAVGDVDRETGARTLSAEPRANIDLVADTVTVARIAAGYKRRDAHQRELPAPEFVVFQARKLSPPV